MAQTRLNILRQKALDLIKYKRRALKQKKKDFLAQLGSQEAKPNDKLVEFEVAALALDVLEHSVSEYVSNPDGSFPCPNCLVEGKRNILTPDIRTDGFHCELCGLIV